MADSRINLKILQIN